MTTYLDEIEARAAKALKLNAKIYQSPDVNAICFTFHNPWENKEESFASVWWPCHPPEVTSEVETVFEDTARFVDHAKEDVEELLARLKKAIKELTSLGRMYLGPGPLNELEFIIKELEGPMPSGGGRE